jgi:hypothetical protein
LPNLINLCSATPLADLCKALEGPLKDTVCAALKDKDPTAFLKLACPQDGQEAKRKQSKPVPDLPGLPGSSTSSGSSGGGLGGLLGGGGG